jgi:imidazolonepropionase-like amidohydrolase/Tol biopolymer transport system component
MRTSAKTASTFAAATLVAVAALATTLAQQRDADRWDITKPTGPTSTVTFETSEGTWMNVDVSPDGRTLVFDLLGDLYSMPIAGSGNATARRLTTGVAFDMQPRFSPDGKTVAFISDRGGLFNIWVADADGSNVRQVSREQRWWINSPSWSPDGQYIYARRHFVGERSLGAGEIWMFHVSGSEGVQVTERPSIQKDAGEPAISPDGRTLYYSRDVSPGPNFDYNRDPYGVIYAIYSRDLATGRERAVANRAGGSITPRVSPDGRRLSFIRRVRLQSVLYVKDLATGEETPVFDGLDRDLQEAWSIHGVYPQYAWTPDGNAIVIWAQGKLWRVSANGSGTPAEIPFRAEVRQEVTEALHFPQQAFSEHFPVRMLTGVRTSPDGNTVVYSAVGKLYVKSIQGGDPRRLTSTDDGFEFAPSFSRDGQWITYVTWSDDARGRVRIMRADGSNGRDVVSTPGHYTEPSFSPDGQSVVYRSVGADGTRGVTHGENRGIFIVPASGGAATLVREGGDDPQFDHTGTRVYFRERRDNRFILASVNRNGGDEVVHFRSENATAVVPSPDGQWVAFAERWHTYVGAFPRTGRPVDIGPRTAGYPVNQISRDAGFNVHWSADSRRVHWTMGGDYYSRDIAESFPFVESRSGEAGPPEAEGVAIGFTIKSDVPASTIAFTGARVITMAGAPIENATVIVEGNRIKSVGRNVSVPAGATRIDARGKTIMPGLIDAHAHLGGEGDGLLAQTSWPLLANLAFGVTTAHDPSNDTETVFTNSELIRRGAKLGPRLFSTGTILYGAETPFKAAIEDYDDALSHLRRLKAAGAMSVKSYNQQRRDVRQMILKAARELQMLVVPEGGSLLYHDLTMITDGHTTIEHSLPVAKIYKDVIDLWAGTKVGYTPTLIVGFGGLSGEFYWYERTNVWEHPRLLAFTPREIVDARSRRRIKAAGDDDFNHIAIAAHANQLQDAGVAINMGAHGQLQGLGAHWETWMMTQGGMTPAEALATATINAARTLGLDREIGSLEAGKLADLVVLDRNPLENIQNTDSVSMVMVNGRLYDAATLNEMASGTRQRGRLYWESASPRVQPSAPRR